MWLNSMSDSLESPESYGEVLARELPDRFFILDAKNRLNPNCVDGRDTDEQRPSLPGGKIGALANVFSALDQVLWQEYDRKEVVNIVKSYFSGTLWGHTDTHNHVHDPSQQCNGCGHVKRLLSSWEKYKLSPESVAELQKQIQELNEDQIDVLEWDHAERSVIIINSPDYWIVSHGKAGQDFIYNKSYVESLFDGISNELSQKFWVEKQEMLDTLLQHSDIHAMNTLKDLATWLPVFQVSGIQKDDDSQWVFDFELEYLDTIS